MDGRNNVLVDSCFDLDAMISKQKPCEVLYQYSHSVK